MKDFIGKHKKGLIIAGVIVGCIIALLIYGVVMSKRTAIDARYQWNGEDQKLGTIGEDTLQPADVTLTAEGNLRLDFYKAGSSVAMDERTSLLSMYSDLYSDLQEADENYKYTVVISYLDALYEAADSLPEESIEVETEAAEEATEEEITAGSINGQLQEEQGDGETIVVPLLPQEDAKESTEEEQNQTTEAYETGNDEEWIQTFSKKCFGMSLPLNLPLRLNASDIGLCYTFDVVIDTLGHINLSSMAVEKMDISFSNVENYDEVAKEYPNLLIPEGVKVTESIPDYVVDEKGTYDFPSMFYSCDDYTRNEVVNIILTKLQYKDTLTQFVESIVADHTTMEANGREVSIYDVGKYSLAVFSDEEAAYCIYGYDKSTMEQVVGEYIKQK